MARVITLRREPSLRLLNDAFPYQHDAVRAIRDLEYAAVFHEQGLGKTKIAIDVAVHWLRNQVVDTVLVVAKKSLVQNWEDELAQHTELRPVRISNNRSRNYFAFNSPARLMLTHYEAVKAEAERFSLFLRARHVAVVLDESAKIKNPDAEITKTFLHLAPLFKRRLIMTGTPVANRPYDIWSQIYFLDQGASLGPDFIAFKSTTNLTGDLSSDPSRQAAFQDAIGKIHRSIADFTVRETKDSDAVTLPNKIIQNIVCDWESRQFDLYRQVRDEMRMIVFHHGQPAFDEADAVLKRLLRLVQIASNPRLVDESYSTNPGKLPELLNLLTLARRNHEKSIVWTSFVGTCEWLRTELSEYNPVRVHGGMDIDARNRSIRRFMSDEEVRILVATTGAAKEGLTLTVANHAVFFDRNFSLDDYLQAQDRIHRVSQLKECHIYNLIMRDSIDEWVDVLLGAKRVAALYAQGDIERDEYVDRMRYDFGQILRGILGQKGDSNGK